RTALAPDQAPPAFPTRRSSDLIRTYSLDQPEFLEVDDGAENQRAVDSEPCPEHKAAVAETRRILLELRGELRPRLQTILELYYRSEEHTSELQSREKLVCRLLL